MEALKVVSFIRTIETYNQILIKRYMIRVYTQLILQLGIITPKIYNFFKIS